MGGHPIKGKSLKTCDKYWSTLKIFQSSLFISIGIPATGFPLRILAKIYASYIFSNFFVLASYSCEI